jgi:hypothetical protein
MLANRVGFRIERAGRLGCAVIGVDAHMSEIMRETSTVRSVNRI